MGTLTATRRVASWAGAFGADPTDQAPGFGVDLSGCFSLAWPGEMGLERLLCAGDESASLPDSSGGSEEPADCLPLGELGGRVVEELPPGPAMAGWLAITHPGSQDDAALAGLADAWRRLGAWAAAGELAAVAEMTSRAAARDSAVGVGPDGRPAHVPQDATAEVGFALRRSRFSRSAPCLPRPERRSRRAHLWFVVVLVAEPPKINPRAADPPYRQIASWLRARILAGEFRPGEDPLPSEKDLQELFEVSRDTARRAVAVLRDEGLVVTVPQRGTYVVPESERPH